jgi:regulation of enolase protein 1 (concanavalin A-like superfamily)
MIASTDSKGSDLEHGASTGADRGLTPQTHCARSQAPWCGQLLAMALGLGLWTASGGSWPAAADEPGGSGASEGTFQPTNVEHGILREVWMGIPGPNVSDLTSNVNYPHNPTSTNLVTTFFEAPTDIAEHYGQRMHGYIIPPTTGDHQFWIASDDGGALYLSTDEDPANVVLIASVPGWTTSREWNKYPEQSSAPIRLEAGRHYYISALMKEHEGGDNLAVRWQLPDGTMEAPIPATRLLPFGIAFSAPVIAEHPADTTAVEGSSAVFEVRLGNTAPVEFQWQRDGVDLPGATASVYVLDPVLMDDHGAQFRVRLSNNLGTVISDAATLSVMPDVTPPMLVTALNLGIARVVVTFSEPVEESSGTNPSNYQIDDGVTISQAEYGADEQSILLTTSPLVIGQAYTLTVNHVRDQAATPNTIVPNSQLTFFTVEYAPADIGEDMAPGSTVPVEDGYLVSGAGLDIGIRDDQFHFGHREHTGDFDVKVRISAFQATDFRAKAGLMARESLASRSRYAAVLATPSLRGTFFSARARSATGTLASGQFPVNYPYTWLRLQRDGDVFRGFASYDGQLWYPLGSATVSLPTTILLGMAVSSHDSQQLAVARFLDLGDAAGEATSSLPPQIDRELLGPSSRRTGMAISEIMYRPRPREDGRDLEFIELFNSLSVPQDLGGWQLTGSIGYTFPEGTVLPAGGFLVVARSPADMEAVYGLTDVLGGYQGRLDRDSGVVQLRHWAGALLLEAEYSALYPWPAAADRAGHSLILARPSYGEGDRQAWAASTFKGGSPGGYDPIVHDALEAVKINEFLAYTDALRVDFIELYNHSNVPVNLSGAFLSDRPHVNKFQIPDGTILPPRGFLVFDETELGFALSAAGEAIYLTHPEDTRVIDAIVFEAQANEISMGRYPDGAPDFHLLAELTPGAPNSPLRISDVVINEIMFNPLSGDDADTYVELHNRSSAPVDLSDWRFVDGIQFTIPDGTVIPANGYLVVAANQERLFSRHPHLNDSNTVGNFDGRLSNSGERLALAMPVEPTSTNPNHVVVDEVTYQDGGRWGEWINRGGSSLELIDPRSDNRRSANWTHSDERAKSEWVAIEHTGVLDNGQGTANELHILMPAAGECLIDNVSVFVQGGPDLVPNGAFESNFSGWIHQGNHIQSGWHTSEGFQSSRSLRVRATGGGDNGANRVKIRLNSSISPGSTVTIRAQGRWRAGHTNVILRLKGNWLEAVGNLVPPPNLGTPGLPNSAYAANIGPAIYDVRHHPILPAVQQSVKITARAHDPDGIASMMLRYRIDPSATFVTVPMVDDGTGGDAVAGDGVHTAVIPAQSAGTLVAYYVQATDGHAAPAVGRYPDEAPALEALVRWGESDPLGTFRTYRMWFTAATIQQWTTRVQMSNERLPGTLVYGNRVIHNIGARYRGSPFIRPGYSSPTSGVTAYSLHVPRDDRFLGTREFNLDGLEQPGRDSTLQRERMSFWIAEQMGIPFSHQTYLSIFLNGVRRGLVYTDSQHIDSDYVRTWWPDDDRGQLFKIDDWFEFNDSVLREFNRDATLQNFTTTGGIKKQARYRWNWNKRSNRGLDDDYSDLFDLVDALNTPGTDAYTAAVEAVVDVEQWMRVFAARRIVADWDGYGYNRGKNTWAYKPTRDRWQLILWDLDFSLGGGSDGPSTFLFGANDPTITRMYNHPPFRRLYLRAFYEALQAALQPGLMNPIMDHQYHAFVANQINVGNPNTIASWVEQRRAYIQGQLNVVAADLAITSQQGNDFSTSNPYLTLQGTAPVAVRTLTVNGVPYPVTWTGVTTWRVRVPLQPGANALVVEGWDTWDRLIDNGRVSTTVTYTGPGAAPEDHLAINEIMYQPAVPDTEFLEIHNTSTTHAFDLTGFRLRGIDFDFEPGTVIEPDKFLLLVKDPVAFQAHYGPGLPVVGVYNGRLHPDGERLRLVRLASDTAPELIVDEVTYGVAPPWPPTANGMGPSLQRIDPTHSSSHPGNWVAFLDPGEPPEPEWEFVSRTGVVGSREFYLYLESAGEAYLDDLFLAHGNSPETGFNYIRNGDFESQLSGPWTVAGNHANTRITTDVNRSGNASLHLLATGGGTGRANAVRQDTHPLEIGDVYTLSYWYLPNPNGADLTMRFRWSLLTPNALSFTHDVTPEIFWPVPYTPGAPNSLRTDFPTFVPLVLNEIQPRNVSGIADNNGDREPWVELHNAGTESIDLSGFYLTDDFSQPTRWAFPAGASIGPQEFRLVWLDGEPEQTTASAWHAAFRIDPVNGSVFLLQDTAVLPVLIDYLQYTQVPADFSYGRFPDSDPKERQMFHHPTPGAPNDPSSIPVTLFINEWMASNSSTIADPADGQYKDWFEIYNPGTLPVDLSGYTLTDRLSEPGRFTVPSGTIVPARGFLLVWADGKPELNGINHDVHTSFSLSRDGEVIGLFAPDGSLVDALTFGPQQTDVSQGRFPDGHPAPFQFFHRPTPGASNVPDPVGGQVTITGLLHNNEGMQFSWGAVPGRTYRIEYKNNLSDPDWIDLVGPITADKDSLTVLDLEAISAPQRYYRILRILE